MLLDSASPFINFILQCFPCALSQGNYNNNKVDYKNLLLHKTSFRYGKLRTSAYFRTHFLE